jgi:hypothetical protein
MRKRKEETMLDLTDAEKLEMNEALLANMSYIVRLFTDGEEKILNAREKNTMRKEILFLLSQVFVLGYGIGRERGKN